MQTTRRTMADAGYWAASAIKEAKNTVRRGDIDAVSMLTANVP